MYSWKEVQNTEGKIKLGDLVFGCSLRQMSMLGVVQNLGKDSNDCKTSVTNYKTDTLLSTLMGQNLIIALSP